MPGVQLGAAMTAKEPGPNRQKAEAMREQAQRAETPYLRAMYQSLADQWSHLVDEVEDATNRKRRNRGSKLDCATAQKGANPATRRAGPLEHWQQQAAPK